MAQLLDIILEELRKQKPVVEHNEQVPDFTHISQEATELVYPTWISITRMKYYAFSNPNLVPNTSCIAKNPASQLSEKSALAKNLFRKMRPIKGTMAFIPGTFGNEENEQYFTAVIPFGSILNTEWSLEALIAQRKADLKMEWKNINKSGFGASVLTRGDFTNSGFQLDKTAAVELSHRQSHGYTKLNMYFNLATFPRLGANSLPLFAIQHVQNIPQYPWLTVAGMWNVEGQFSGAVRVTPRDDTILTMKASRKRVRVTALNHVSETLSIAGDLEWKGDVAPEASVNAGVGVECRTTYSVFKASASTDGLFSIVVEAIPKVPENNNIRFAVGGYCDLIHNRFGVSFGINV